MQIVNTTRNLYRKYIHLPQLDAFIYTVLDGLTDAYAFFAQFTFPANYIRRWKLNMLWGKYEPETYSFFEKLIKPNMIIVDIGAHIGYFTRLFSRLTGRKGFVYALEADPENFSLLKKNTKHLKNVALLPIAVSNKTASINFYRSEKTGCHSTIQDLSQHKETITVPSSDLDSLLLNKDRTQKVDIIKMDIEGGELNALKGMQKILRANPNISLVIEFNPGCLKQAAVAPREFITYLSSLGFYTYAIHQNALIPITTREPEPEKYLLSGATFVNLYCSKISKQDNI